MKKIIFFLFLFVYSSSSQQLEIIISINKAEFDNTTYKREKKDPLILRTVLHNRSADSVIIKYVPYFELEYSGDEPAYGKCFRLYELDSAGKYLYYPFDTYESFVTVAPYDSLTKEGYFTVSWPCRGAPPSGDWNFELKYYREITEEENYYIVKSRYTDAASKEMKKAWTGVLSSNIVKLKIKR